MQLDFKKLELVTFLVILTLQMAKFIKIYIKVTDCCFGMAI